MNGAETSKYHILKLFFFHAFVQGFNCTRWTRNYQSGLHRRTCSRCKLSIFLEYPPKCYLLLWFHWKYPILKISRLSFEWWCSYFQLRTHNRKVHFEVHSAQFSCAYYCKAEFKLNVNFFRWRTAHVCMFFLFVCLSVCFLFVCLFVLSHLLRIEVVLEVAISPTCCTPVHVVNCKQTFCLFYLHRKIITTYLTLNLDVFRNIFSAILTKLSK